MEEKEIEVWGLKKEAAWWIFGLLGFVTGGIGWIGLLFWNHDYEKAKKQEESNGS